MTKTAADPLVELILAATYEPNASTHPERRAERVAAALRANPEIVLSALGATTLNEYLDRSGPEVHR